MFTGHHDHKLNIISDTDYSIQAEFRGTWYWHRVSEYSFSSYLTNITNIHLYHPTIPENFSLNTHQILVLI